MGTFSKLGTALFVAAVGIAAGFSLQNGIGERDFFYFSVGVLMVIAGILGMRVVSCLDATMDQSLLMGLLCGALTSTPGLSAACEVEGVLSELAILGYGCAYPFGVISTVVFAQLMTRNARMTGKQAIHIQEKSAASGNMSVESLMSIGIAVIFGSVVGQTKLPFTQFSLGNSGGVLCVGILVGFLLAKVKGNFDALNSALSFYRNFGLVIFFVGSGVSAGMTLHMAFEIKWFAYGALFTVLPVLCGYWICRSILRQTLDKSMCIVAGGMTSTPTLGVLLRNTNLAVDLSAYSMAYVGALLTIMMSVFLCSFVRMWCRHRSYRKSGHPAHPAQHPSRHRARHLPEHHPSSYDCIYIDTIA
jgi:putative transport protein